MTKVPHLRVVIAASLLAVLGYLGFSLWAVLVSRDATVIGDVIGTWKSFAVLAFGFWLGSSSGGKAKDGEPTPVTVENPPEKPANVSQVDDPEARHAGL